MDRRVLAETPGLTRGEPCVVLRDVDGGMRERFDYRANLWVRDVDAWWRYCMNSIGYDDITEDEAREIIARWEVLSMLDKARKICMEKHAGQVDKAGEPYYLHPFAVAEAVNGEEAKTVAYLHDVVEDTDATLEWLASQGFPANVVEAVDAITRRDGEPYADYIERVGRNALARTVKVADLKHNLDPSRRGATESMRERYSKALAELEGAVSEQCHFDW